MDLKKADLLISECQRALDYQLYMTPKNYSEENAKFLSAYDKGIVYNPQYRYEPFRGVDQTGLDRVLEEVREGQEGIAGFVRKAAESLRKEIRMYQAIGNDQTFTDAAVAVYRLPNKALMADAERFLKETPPVEAKSEFCSAEEMATVISDRLKEYGFLWKVVLSENMASRISVEPTQKTVFINQKKSFSKPDTIRLVVHEVDTHVLRSENGNKQGFEVLANGTAESLIHEEGLALYNEWKNGVRDVATMKLYAARFLCCCRSELSFYEMFDMLIKLGCPREQAMYVVPRIKRGLSDTASAGGFIKDYVYYQGFFDIKNRLDHDPEAYDKLYFGSISIEDLALLCNDIECAQKKKTLLCPLPLSIK